MKQKINITNILIMVINQAKMRILMLLLINVICYGIASPNILRQLNITESENYGDWTYSSIEFTDSLTILKGSFKAKSICWIGSNRDEALEINGKKLYVIDTDLPYSVEQKIFNVGDSINFTYIFEPVSGIVGLNNVKHSRFILPIFFNPNWNNGVANDVLADFYLRKAIQYISIGVPYASLKCIEKYFNLSGNKTYVSEFLKTHNFYSNISTEGVLSALKRAQLFYDVDELECYQETLIELYENYDIFNYVDCIGKENLIQYRETLDMFLNSLQIIDANPRFVLFCLDFLESTNDYNAASDIISLYKRTRSFSEYQQKFIIHEAFLRALDSDSIQQKEVNQQVINNLENKFIKEYYSFMFNKFKRLNKIDLCVNYGDSLYNQLDEIERPKYANEIFELAESYIKLKKFDKALFYHKAFEKYSLLMTLSLEEKEDIVDLRKSNSIRFINLSDYPSVVISTEHNKEWLQELYGIDSEEYANNIFCSAIGYNGVGNTEKANEYFHIAYNLLKEHNPYSTFRIQSIYYLALNSMYEKDYIKTRRLMDEANRLFAHNNNSKLKQKLLRLEIELDLNTKNYDGMYFAMEELQKYLNNDPSIHEETFLNTTQGDFFLNQKMYSESLNMYLANEQLLLNNSIDPTSDVYINCLYNLLNVYFNERTNIQMIYFYAQRLWSSLREQLLSSLDKLSKNERYKIVELYEDKLDLIQESLIVVNNDEANCLLYDILLFRKGLLLSTEIKKNRLENKTILNSSVDAKNDSVNSRTINISAEGTVSSEFSWLDIKNNLTKESIAIEFIAFKDSSESNIERYNALVISEDCNAPILIQIGLIPCLLNPTEDIYSSSVLYSKIWQPILEQFPDVTDIYFSADGAFHKTAIENVKLPSGRLLKEKYNLHRVSSTKILTNEFSQNMITSNVFYGGLFYDGDSDSHIVMGTTNNSRSISPEPLTSMEQLRGGIRYLPGSKREVETINAQMDSLNISYTTFFGSEGTELSFRRLQGSKFNILHLATHGFFQEEGSCENYDFKFLNDAKRKHFDIEDQLLLNSGLFFAFANSTISLKSNLPEENDGIMTAKDLTKMDFSAIDMVVLSACQTGLGTINGEGVFGLQRGFKVSGAMTLLMSLWPVDDDATQLLMVYFYKNLLNNRTKYESLMIAQNSLRRTAGFEDSDYWAGWILLDGLN